MNQNTVKSLIQFFIKCHGPDPIKHFSLRIIDSQLKIVPDSLPTGIGIELGPITMANIVLYIQPKELDLMSKKIIEYCRKENKCLKDLIP